MPVPTNCLQTYLFRVINAGSLLYQTVCFEGHDVRVVAVDAVAVDPVTFAGCVDVNIAQR